MQESRGWLDRTLSPLMYALRIFQISAISEGLFYLLNWPYVVCLIIALAMVFFVRLPLIWSALGILGAHYAWNLPWWIAILIFTAPTLLFFWMAGMVAMAHGKQKI